MRTLLPITVAVALLALAAPAVVAQEGGETGFAPESAWTPPPCTEPSVFLDVPCSAQFSAWVQQLFNDAITSGCAVPPGMPPGVYFCPNSYVTRRQMAVFLERAMRGTAPWTPGDVTAVTTPIGSGLVGGADSGEVGLAIASQGVLTEHLGNAQVTLAKLSAQPATATQVLGSNGTDLALKYTAPDREVHHQILHPKQGGVSGVFDGH